MSHSTINPDYVLIDGHLIAYKRFFALHRFSGADGMPIGMIMGVVNSILSFRKSFPESKFVMCFDKDGISQKREIYPGYKAQRTHPPTSFYKQLRIVKNLMPMLGVDCVEIPGCEADQLIATYAKVLPGKKLIVSDDKDLAQCVNDNVRLYQKPGKNWMQIDSEDVLLRYGVPPVKIPDLLALAGDKADNITGVPGIGEVSARALLENHMSAMQVAEDPNVLNNPKYSGIFTPRAISELAAALKLTTLPGNIDVPIPSEALPDPVRAVAMLSELGLRQMCERVKQIYPDVDWNREIDVNEVMDLVHQDILFDTPKPRHRPDVWDTLPVR